ncbi:MAG TPA: glycine/betaine ABC transporter substrate-binding protein, partial [Dongiaceae bacterium]
FQQLKFTIDFENRGIQMMLRQGQKGPDAARLMLRQHPELVKAWLDGVTTLDGQDGLAAVQKVLGAS